MSCVMSEYESFCATSFASKSCFVEVCSYVDMTAVDGAFANLLRKTTSSSTSASPTFLQHGSTNSGGSGGIGTTNSPQAEAQSKCKSPTDNNEVPDAQASVGSEKQCGDMYYIKKEYQGQPYWKKLSKRLAKKRKKKKNGGTGAGATMTGNRPRGLAAIVQGILGRKLDKSQQVGRQLTW